MKAVEFFLFNLLLHMSLGYTVLHKSPVGIRLCEQICFNSVDCEIFTFLPVQLMCFKDNLTSSLEEQHVVRRPRKPKIMNTANCQFGSVDHKNKSNHQVCRQEKESKLRSSSLNKLRMRDYKEMRKGDYIYLYKIYENRLSWDNAMAKCKQEGGFLAQLEDTFKWDFVHEVGRFKFPDCGTWVGLLYQEEKGHFVWHDRTVLKHNERMVVNYLKYHNSKFWTRKYCFSLNPPYGLYKFDCTYPRAFLCEVITKRS